MSEPDPIGVAITGLRAFIAEVIRWAQYPTPPGPAVDGKLDVKFDPPPQEEKKDG
jgi:hypothetical protein